MRALDIDVPDALLTRWVEWFAPAVQPFLADSDLAATITDHAGDVVLSEELEGTYHFYGVQDELRYVWLTEAQFLAMPRARRAVLVRAQRTHERELVPSVRAWVGLVGDRVREQADGHRFVWWPSLLAGHEEQVLVDFIEEGRHASRHDQVPERVWESAAAKVPGARSLAGSFAAASGPNCFGAVMGAAGVAGASSVWVVREPFEEWLTSATRPGGDDNEPGTVFVWRSPDGLVQHAAVTLGGGWVFHKPSSGWMSPYKILTIAECKASSRAIGRRLERHTIVG